MSRHPFTDEDIEHAMPFLGPLVGSKRAHFTADHVLQYAWDSAVARKAVETEWRTYEVDNYYELYLVAIIKLPEDK
jgi:hypothetical protein